MTSGTPSAAIDGQITRVDTRGRQIFCFEGVGLHKVGRGETIQIVFKDTLYIGELVAIAPTRAIVLISNHRADHGIRSSTSTIAVSA